jgi:OOP family OmpA-OmpF porin
MFTRFNKKAVFAVALLAGGIGAAHAEDFYVGGSVGAPYYHDSINGIGGTGGGTGLKVYGGYQLTPNFAVEGGLFRLGRTTDSNGTAKVRGGYLDGVGSYEFSPRWSALGSVGVAEGRFSTTLGNDSSPALKLGAGLQYDLTKTVAVRLKYEQYRFVNAFEAKPGIGEASIGIKVGF